MKRDLKSIQTNLAALADGLPSQRVPEPRPLVAEAHDAPRAVPREAPGEPVIQFSLSLRKSLRKELARLAADADMTMRAFVLNALKEKGLAVMDDDLVDLRKKN